MGTYKIFSFLRNVFQLNEKLPPQDVIDIFTDFAGSNGHLMDADHLLRFLIEFQGEVDATISYAEKLIENLTRDRVSTTTTPGISVYDFFQYLFSDVLNPPIRSQVHHDMTSPMSHYYVFTGHNSYLTGNQLSSDSSDVPIITALNNGVRVIELDMWPNQKNNDVDILHGWTLTSPVKLSRCLVSIKEHAFASSPYPVVVNLEDHLTSDLQTKVAEMFVKTFGDVLFYPKSETLVEFPSPDSLKKRIMISTPPPKECINQPKIPREEKKTHQRGAVAVKEGEEEEEEEDWGDVVSDIKDELNKYNNKDPNFIPDEDEDDDEDNHKLVQKIAPQYRHLITITEMKPKHGWLTSLKVDLNKVRLLNLSEIQLLKATESYGASIVRFTQKNIVRVYPKGTRFQSSNYNPLVGWMHGAQMVAFNMQGHGRRLWLMQGFFRSNGGCGYVKKPDFLMTDSGINAFHPTADLPVKKTLKVKVYMGYGWSSDFKRTHFDNFSPPDFYTRVGIAGVPVDTVMKKTKVVDNDWCPTWNEEFEFPLTVPELGLVRIEVFDHDMYGKGDFGGQTCLPVAELRPGIRAVPLYNSKGEKYKTVVLLVRFRFLI